MTTTTTILPVSPSELKYAAQELAKLRQVAGPQRFDLTVHPRLRALVAAERRRGVRALIISRLPPGLASATAAAAVAEGEEAAVTAAELKQAGLTLAAITASDATLNGQALIMAGVISTHAHMLELGVATFDDMLRLLGPPRELAICLWKATLSKQAWEEDFRPNLKFDFRAWLGTRNRLTPVDLQALNFCLGAQLDIDPQGTWALAKTDVKEWLGKAPRDLWISAGQLRPDQYDRLIAQ